MKTKNLFSFYIKAEKLSPKAKDRYDVTFQSGYYGLFETKLLNKTTFNVGGFSFNYTKKQNTKSNSSRSSEMCISRNGYISGVFIPDISLKIGYGDIKDTSDAIILLFSKDYATIELFVAIGLAKDQKELYSQVCVGVHNDEIESLRTLAIYVFKQKDTNSVTKRISDKTEE